MMRLLVASCLLVSANVFAAENVGPPELEIVTMLGSLLLVIVCIFVFAYLMKQTNLIKNSRGKSQIKIIATQPLTNKGRVQMIEVDGQQYLLGVTEQNITLLDKLDKPVTVAEPEPQKVTTPFSVLLAKINKKSDE